MSLPVLTWVLDHSEERLGNRLVLLALAEHAHDDGRYAWPSVHTLEKRTRLSERQVRNCLRSLEQSQAIIHTGQSKAGTHIYTVVGPFNTGANSAGGQNFPGQSSTSEVSQIAPEPSVTVSSSSSFTRARGKSPGSVNGKAVSAEEHAQCDEILDAFNEATGKKFAAAEFRRGIIMRMREHPEVTLDEHRSLIGFQVAHPWWSGDPTPSVIYGKGSTFDRALNGARGSANGRGGENGIDLSVYDRAEDL